MSDPAADLAPDTSGDRGGDRRQGQRRNVRRTVAIEESWFGKPVAPTEVVGTPAPNPDGDDADVALGDADPAPVAAGAAPAAFERIFGVFVAARAALGAALIVAVVAGGVFGLRPSVAVTVVSVGYAALATALWAWPGARRTTGAATHLRGRQWSATIGVDLLAFMALHMLASGSSLNYVALLVLPVLMAGVLTPRLMALATAAAATLGLLAVAWIAVVGGAESTSQLTQAGLAGTGFFVITVLASEVAGRLAREELAARGSREMARRQAQLNQLVIEEMQDGVLVVDRRGRVQAANPAARRLLAPTGLAGPAPFQLRGVAAWQALVEAVERAFGEVVWPEGGRDVALAFGTRAGEPGEPAAVPQRTLRVRVRFTTGRAPQDAEEFCVLFLEDVRNMQARSRQERLAAMGRVSAGIAHEIRNPLAAIAQANGLLSEDIAEPGQQRLARMVGANVERLKRIVDDVMELASDAAADVGPLDARLQVGTVCAEWAQAHGVRMDASGTSGGGVGGEDDRTGGPGVVRVRLPPEALLVRFDAEHMRRVLVNLLDNALRHASGAPGSIEVRLESRHENQAFLGIASDGPPIPPGVEPHLFEPFFSTRSRGSGLGLYICRELCERYGARIDYRLRGPASSCRNEFFVEMQRRIEASAECPLP